MGLKYDCSKHVTCISFLGQSSKKTFLLDASIILFQMKSKKTDKGGYLVQALLCDETYFIPALFSEDCLKDFQQ